MTTISISVRRALLALIAAATLIAPGPTFASDEPYGITVKVARKSELAKVKTYTWQRGHQAFDKAVDAQIQGAIDARARARGLTKVESGPADVVATYDSLSRLDVDLKSRRRSGPARLFQVGTLVIDLLGSKTAAAFPGAGDKPITADRARLETIINRR